LDGEEGVLMNARALFQYGLLCILGFSQVTYGIITTLSKNDPAPPYTVDNPFALLGTRRYEYLKGREEDDPNDKHMSLEIMPFFQRANRGADACGDKTELGDIGGRLNMIAILPFNLPATTAEPSTFINTNEDLPCTCEFPQILVSVRDQLIDEIEDLVSPANVKVVPEELQTVQGLLDLQQTNTTNQLNFGYFSVPMKYKKRGIRFNAQFYLGKGLGATIQTGFADIHQCATFTDRTIYSRGNQNNPFNQQSHNDTDPSESIAHIYTPTWVEICKKVSTILMANLDDILTSTQICQDRCTFHEKSIEDLHGELFWRYPIEINKKELSSDYPKFLFIPFIAAGGSYGAAKKRNPCQLLGLPFGNNEHNAIRVRGGFSLDFYDTLQLNFEGGGTYFRDRLYCNFPLPTNFYQNKLYPFRTNIRYCPGNNWHMVMGMYARNFFSHWSFTFNYIFVSHEKDCIRLLCNNYAAGTAGQETTCRDTIHPFKPSVLECKSDWSSQVFDTALTYSIAPNFSLGFLIQIPIKRKNAYRSSTYMASLYLSF